MGYTLKLQLDIRFKKNTPNYVFDFLVNGKVLGEQQDFAYFRGDDSKENQNIFTVKHQYRFTQNGQDEYLYELFARIFVRDDDFNTIFKFCTYFAQFADNEGFVGYYQNVDNLNAQPELLYFQNGNVTVKDITSGVSFTTNWHDENNPNL
jgi:hypothetical protein